MSERIQYRDEIIYTSSAVDDPNEPTPGEDGRVIERDIEGYFEGPRGKGWQLVERYAGHVVFARPKGVYDDTEQETSAIIIINKRNPALRYIRSLDGVTVD